MNEKLKSIKGLILDGDGVWFTGQEFRAVIPSGDVIVLKPRHHHDGQGVSFMRAIGLKILFATAEGQPMGSVVEKLNKLPSVKSGAWAPVSVLMDLKEQGTKVDAIEHWLEGQGLTWADCAYIGDDRTDYECMQRAGISVTPANGQRLIKNIAHLTLTKDGGAGAIREFAEMVLDARGINESTLPAA
jgi:3-deoxy-D-manno-octulosonate 8-phosphate phosphatase (KDO 8-P phosphatase)